MTAARTAGSSSVWQDRITCLGTRNLRIGAGGGGEMKIPSHGILDHRPLFLKVGSFSNDDGDGNENVKNPGGLLGYKRDGGGGGSDGA